MAVHMDMSCGKGKAKAKEMRIVKEQQRRGKAVS